MAELGAPRLTWPDESEGSDPGLRVVELPAALPEIGDDFDWQQRDFDSFRNAMTRELQDRFPERTRWTTADVEAVLVDALATQLDQLSDMADRVSAEASLATARRPESVLAWLHLIGYDPTRERYDPIAERGVTVDELLALYASSPQELEFDRRRGPAAIRRQRRMATLADYADRIEEHPLVSRAYSDHWWNGSWFEITVVVGGVDGRRLDDEVVLAQLPERERQELKRFAHRHALDQSMGTADGGLPAPGPPPPPSLRSLLGEYVAAFRLVGHVVHLEDLVPVGLEIELTVHIDDRYFRSEIRREVERVLGRGPTGFFRPGRLAAGEAVHQSDIYGALMPLDGIRRVEIVRFAKEAAPADAALCDDIPLGQDELAVIDDARGALRVRFDGGRRG